MGNYPTRVNRHNLTLSVAGNYAAGDAVGNRCEWPVLHEAGTRGGVNLSFVVALNSTEQPALDIFLFGAAFTATTDNSPAGFGFPDLRDHGLGVVKVPIGAWSSGANNGMASVSYSLALQCSKHNGAGILYGQVVARSAFTPVAMTVSCGVLVD